MKTLLWMYGVWLCMLGPGLREVPAGDLTELVKDARSAVVTVRTYNKDGAQISQGTGFFVHPAGQMLTCYHVLENAYRIEARTFDGGIFPVESVLAVDVKADLAKTMVKLGGATVRALKPATRMPEMAEQIVVIGTPLGLEQTVSVGIVSALRENWSKAKAFQMSASISKGSSGSPVLDLEGRVLGVASSQIIEGQNLNFAVSFEPIQKILHAKTGTGTSSLQQAVPIDEAAVAQVMRRARSWFSRGKYELALEYIENVGEGSRQYRSAMLLSGMCHGELGQHDQQILSYRRALRMNPADIEAYLALGMAYGAAGAHAEAIRTYRDAVGRAPTRTDIHLLLALAYGQVGAHRDAVEAYKGAIKIDPACADAYYGIGIAQYKRGRFEAAVKAYEQALKYQPEHTGARLGLGLALAALDRTEQAMEQYSVLKDTSRDMADRLLAALEK